MHPSGMTGLDLRANRVEDDPVFLLVDFGPAGTITSPVVLKTLSVDEARTFARTVMNRLPERVPADGVLRCQWDGSADDVQPRDGEFLCAGCRATIARGDILSGLPE